VRIGLYLADLRRSQTDSHGTINYALGLLHALPHALESGDELLVLANAEMAAELGQPDGWTLEVTRVPESLSRRLVTDHLLSQVWARRARLDVVHYPKGHIPLWRPHRPAVVATIHDDIAVQYARGSLGAVDSRLKRAYFAWAVIHAARGADRVLTVSHFSAGQIRALTNRSPDRVAVTYEASALPDIPFVTGAEREPTLLVFASTVAHKRTTQTLRWILRYLDQRQSSLVVTVVGKLPPGAASLSESPTVRLISDVLSNRDVADLLAHSRALVFGSVYEGFGLPPVEAYMLGTPAVYALSPALDEVMDGLPGGFGREDYGAFAAALDEVLALGDGDLRAAKADILRRYTWDEVARLTVEAYRVANAVARSPYAQGP
jgi:glycosyltransferase involved in cell wall biosynthesis